MLTPLARAVASTALAAATVVLTAATPAAPIAAGSAFIPHPIIQLGHHPRVAADQTSSNWSGYAVTGGSYTHVTGTWRVPAVTPTATDRYSSTWIGIGGYNTGDVTLIQAGTEQDSVGGAAQYTAWTEIIPEPESAVSLPVSAGDMITCDISEGMTGMWTIVLTNRTINQSSTTNVVYPALMQTAEWIHEATTIVGQSSLHLAQTARPLFRGATANGRTIAEDGSWIRVLMNDSGGDATATPSDLTPSGDAFRVADGPDTPPVPVPKDFEKQ